MKLKYIALPLLVAAFGSALSAQIAGKVGNVTVALSASYEIGGFNKGEDYYKITKDTDTQFTELYKSAIAREKYGNKQLIEDLMERYDLEGKVSDYSLRFVEADEFSGYYIVNKDLSVVIYIGGSYSSSTSQPINTYYADDEGNYFTPAYAGSGSENSVLKNGVTTYTGKGNYKVEGAAPYIYLNPTDEDYVEAFSLRKGGYSYSYSEKYTEEDGYFDEKSTYSVPASSYSDIVGTDYYGTTVTGSIKTSALKDTADVTVYYQAHPSYVSE